MMFWALVPFFSFLMLFALEKKFPASTSNKHFTASDWLMNLSGFGMQGLVIPLVGYFLATCYFPALLPGSQGVLPLGFAGAFLLNFIGVDFLYYLQHRAFHAIPSLWKLHAPHHHSPVVNIWVTSRNALVTHFLFVYMLINPILGYLCDFPEGFFAGAMLTAALDLFRHANLRVRLPFLEGIILLPQDHHRHHDADRVFANYGANFIIWDRLFGTVDRQDVYPLHFTVSSSPSLTTQLLFPWRVSG
jgi:sterol desaturase/sphingolipid hydroxylase (fatty acid hydroxylase superfamily)